jgi:hypothetical protein
MRWFDNGVSMEVSLIANNNGLGIWFGDFSIT